MAETEWIADGTPASSSVLLQRRHAERTVATFNSALSCFSLASSLVEASQPLSGSEALSSHPQQPVLVNNNSLLKNSGTNLFALLLSVPGFYPQRLGEGVRPTSSRAVLAEPVSRSEEGRHVLSKRSRCNCQAAMVCCSKIQPLAARRVH